MAKSYCVKCGGKGRIPAFSHIENGICFACNGSGEFSHPASKTGKGLFEVVNEHALWQFSTFKNCFRYHFKKGEVCDDMLVQAVSGAGKSGKTLFRIRLIGSDEIAVARRIYKSAMANIHPDEITNEWLGFTPGRCQVDRNKKGVSFL